ncbi:MAG: bifunctional riboflavin kinase/FAD synthetase [Actinobacteria bacterium]|nr:bifunctional riboflavin kinase/FAD synthetase [Actinomycetota bacterium]MBT4476305.1 bifunctional riboflavin kinase/FAD synthetase [Actinomycetota bacterium]MBT5118745.1 bifunctional riboflavin kinase/FAD synthetase [Actinomycetota bacterium]
MQPARPDSVGTVLTIGAYDGVHRGHRKVIAEVCRLAEERGLGSAVVTFDRHPASVVRPESAPLLLTDLEQKLELLAATGVDQTLVVPFDEQRAAETAEDFVTNVLVGCLKVKLIVVGEDFHFGFRRLGNVALLREMGQALGFAVTGLGLVGMDGEPARDHEQVSSTFIRRALGRGDLARANAMLGRPYEVRGTVVKGDQRGRTLGFPTANVRVDASILLPADGVYAGRVELPSGERRDAALSLGTRPHFFNDGDLLLEAHLIDFSGDLYGQEVNVSFEKNLRPQQKFENLEALVAQLEKDVASATQWLQ